MTTQNVTQPTTEIHPFTGGKVHQHCPRDALETALEQAWSLANIGGAGLSTDDGDWAPQVVQGYMAAIRGTIEQAKAAANNL